jgi:hypothetical protein
VFLLFLFIDFCIRRCRCNLNFFIPCDPSSFYFLKSFQKSKKREPFLKLAPLESLGICHAVRIHYRLAPLLIFFFFWALAFSFCYCYGTHDMPPIVTGSGRTGVCGRWRVTREMIPIFLYTTKSKCSKRKWKNIERRWKQMCSIFFLKFFFPSVI